LAQQRFAERISHGSETIRACVAHAQQSLLTTTAAQKKAIQVSLATARSQLDQHIALAESQLATSEGVHRAAIEERQTERLAESENAFRTRQDRADELTATFSDRSFQTAEEVSGQLVSQTQARSQEAESIGAAKAKVSGSTAEIAEAKAQVAHEIASDTATKISEGVSDGAEQLRATGPQAADSFRQHGKEIQDQLGAGQPQLVDQVTAVFHNAGTLLQQARTAGELQLGHFRKAVTGQFSAAEQNTLSHLEAQVAHKSREVRMAGDHAIASLHEQGEKTIAASEAGVGELSERISRTNVGMRTAPELAGQISSQISGAISSLTVKAENAVGQITDSIARSGTAAMAAITNIHGHLAQQIPQLVGQVSGQAKQQSRVLENQMALVAAQSDKAASGTIGQVSASLDGKLVEVDQAFAKSLADYRASLTDQVTSADAKARDPLSTLPSRIDDAQSRAEERAKKGFFERQWDDFKEMVSDPGFWAGLVVGLVLAIVVVALIVAGTLTGGLAIVLVMAAVGAVAAAVGSIVSQATGHSFSGGWDWSRVDWKQVGISALIGAAGAAAITALVVWMGPAFAASLGGIAIISLAAGAITLITNLLTPGQPWDKDLLANMAFAFIFSLLAKFILPKEVPPEERPPEEKPPSPAPTTLEELFSRLSTKAQEGFTQQKELLPEKAFREMQNAFKNPDGTFDVDRANRLFESKWLEPDEFQKRLNALKGKLPKSWDAFEAELNDKFKVRLRAFRGNDNLESSPALRGGEGQLFLSDLEPTSALKRWFEARLGELDQSVGMLRDASSAVSADPNLSADIDVVKIHEQADDWILRDFDPTSRPLSEVSGNPDANAARERVIARLEGTSDPSLRNILGKLKSEPPSANVHWSPARNKLLIIDMQ
jgi:hypothetical protein